MLDFASIIAQMFWQGLLAVRQEAIICTNDGLG